MQDFNKYHPLSPMLLEVKDRLLLCLFLHRSLAYLHQIKNNKIVKLLVAY
jgi:hypothetical protein